MGNNESRSSRLPTFNRQNWHQDQYKILPRRQYGQCTLYRNNLTNQYVEEYPIYFHNNSQFDKYLQFFQWRQREEHIVNTKFIRVQENSQFCNSTHNGLVYIEHIPLRLCNIEDIPYPQNLYVLFAAIDGFQKIFYFTGYFTPRQDLVCIDSNGSVKVWINADLSRCSTSQSSYYDNPHLNEEQMVEQIISMIQKNTSEEIDAGMTFSQYVWRMHKDKKLTFKQAKQEIINYATKYDTQIPNYFQSIMMLIDDRDASELDEQLISQRVKTQEEKILKKNRQNYHYQRQDTTYNKVNGIRDRQDSIINQVLPREQQVPRARSDTQALPAFKVMHQPQPQPIRAHQPQLQTQRIYSAIPSQVRGRVNSTIPVKFNYGGIQTNSQVHPVSTPTAHFLAPNNEKRIEQTSPPSILSLPPQQISRNPMNRLPQNTVPEQKAQYRSQAVEQKAQIIQRQRASKIMYSDSTQTYQLDDEIANDIFKYFGEVKI